ncbi:MAG: type 4b pilus protein PilO2 [Alphaproteobacteria bacterium]|nr:type 4b pilus protein PilO2 [Alphaproteobacteria bacterium]
MVEGVENQVNTVGGYDLNQNGSITINRREYAVGLLWQPLQNSDEPFSEIREAIDSDPEADLYCLRSTSTPQYGIGKKSMKHRAGEPSAAAAVASALSEYTSVAAVFPVPEGWWLVAIRNDLILSEEDVLYTSEQEAQNKYYSLMSLPDWDLKIAPESWAIDKSRQISLETLLKKSGAKVVLEELGAVKKTQILTFIALGFVGLIFFLLYLVSSLWKSAFTEEKIEAVAIPEVIQPVEPVPEKPKPWEKVPKMDVFLHKCWNNAYQLTSLTIPGWQIGQINCNLQGLTTGWSKSWNSAGRIAWLKAALNEYKMSRVNVQLNQDGTSATGQLSFTDIPMVASVPTIEESQLWDELTDIRQATNIQLNFSRQTVMDPPNNPDGTRPANQQEYVFFQFSISSPYSPFEWLAFFEKFPGLELTSINFNPGLDAQDKWKYEGRIYAK